MGWAGVGLGWGGLGWGRPRLGWAGLDCPTNINAFFHAANIAAQIDKQRQTLPAKFAARNDNHCHPLWHNAWCDMARILHEY